VTGARGTPSDRCPEARRPDMCVEVRSCGGARRWRGVLPCRCGLVWLGVAPGSARGGRGGGTRFRFDDGGPCVALQACAYMVARKTAGTEDVAWAGQTRIKRGAPGWHRERSEGSDRLRGAGCSSPDARARGGLMSRRAEPCVAERRKRRSATPNRRAGGGDAFTSPGQSDYSLPADMNVGRIWRAAVLGGSWITWAGPGAPRRWCPRAMPSRRVLVGEYR
jgi:hypothetical protein